MSDLVEIAERRRGTDGPGSVRFCTSCGELVEESPERRVCPHCGLGVVITAVAGALPAPRAAFLVVDRDQRVTAVSAAGERIFGGDASGRQLSSVVSARDGNGEIARQVARAANGLSGTVRLEVTVPGRRGAFEARISPCGPPRAALVAVERPRA